MIARFDARMARRRTSRIATAVELFFVYACVLLYIWRWQRSHPLLWIPILAFVILTHVLHGDTPAAMGLTAHEAGPSSAIILPLAAVIYGAVVVYALAAHRFVLAWPHGTAAGRFADYAIWCCFQQYLMQSYFYRRLVAALQTPHGSAAVVALMFGGAHAPNTALMIATLAGGFILAEVFARHPSIWPLALVQAVGGVLLAAVVPASLIHNMRVGPGYYAY